MFLDVFIVGEMLVCLVEDEANANCGKSRQGGENLVPTD